MALKSIPRATKPKSAQRFTRALLAWFERAGRDLPWRRTRDPYRIVVSEFMLQQTQVSRVLEYYPRFLKRFPTVGKLAAARPKAVREEWEGLGYYARASNLHALTRVVSEHHDGKIPADPEELIKLPGVGRYTAGAVASFAYEKSVAAVDTNVGRVIRRVFVGDVGTLGSGGVGKKRDNTRKKSNVPTPPRPHDPKLAWEIAATLVPKDGRRAWKFNQAIMELGAVICVARKPKCAECPVRKDCKTGRRGRI